jgi:hypothetical protein
VLIDFSHRFAAEPLYYGYPIDTSTGQPILQAGRHVMGGAERFSPGALAIATPRCLAEHVAGLLGAIDPSHRDRGALLIQPALEADDQSGMTVGKVVCQRVRLAPQEQDDDRPGDVVFSECLAFQPADIARGAPHLYVRMAERLTGAGLSINYDLDDVRRRAIIAAAPSTVPIDNLSQLGNTALRLVDAVSRGRRILLGRRDCENEANFLEDAQAALAMLPAPWRPFIGISVGLSRPGPTIHWAFSEDCPEGEDAPHPPPAPDVARLTAWLAEARTRAEHRLLVPTTTMSQGGALRAALAGRGDGKDIELDDAMSALDRQRCGRLGLRSQAQDQTRAISQRLGDLVNISGAWTPSMMRSFARDPAITDRLVELSQGPERAWGDWIAISLALAAASPTIPANEVSWMYRRLGPRDAKAIGPARGEGPSEAVARAALSVAMAPGADPELAASAGGIAAYLAEAGRFDLVQRELHALVDRLGAMGSSAAAPLASIGAALSKSRAMVPQKPPTTPAPNGRLHLVRDR